MGVTRIEAGSRWRRKKDGAEVAVVSAYVRAVALSDGVVQGPVVNGTVAFRREGVNVTGRPYPRLQKGWTRFLYEFEPITQGGKGREVMPETTATTTTEPAEQIYNGGEPHTHDGLRAALREEAEARTLAEDARDELKLHVTRLESERVDLVRERDELRERVTHAEWGEDKK